MLLRGTYTFAIDSDRRNGYPVAPSSLPHFGTAIMDDPTSDILGARDFGLVQQLLNEILNAENCKCARAQQAVVSTYTANVLYCCSFTPDTRARDRIFY